MEKKNTDRMNTPEDSRIGVHRHHAFTVPEAIRLWGKACNYHRGTDTRHQCGNPAACQRRLDQAFSAELSGRGYD